MRESNELKRKARADEKATETHEEKAARLEKQRLSKTTARAVEKATETHEEKRFRAPRTTMDVSDDDVKAKVADNMA
ncbi:hypothetical protein SDRG_03464 [Saprolegnia diclina VS20]|uniref:Uncharacterized protein n=1 Tax=Saprolegnia diclina (strain VS20) TaxID=1156394 RepID=T0QMD2_SAPDV|nr:hypothetical protein SDRG_03464 [Saprolegnia diclina VS20]EQC39259.1 hypothetical protein SDRG_03464 [Saprolegnia diclina VS20]|eukprot:XP_008607320.1 hypothetical protein SDRG_03464 [Saprolegnia diclina VS20]